MSEATARPSRRHVLAPDSAEAIYGTVAAMAVIAGTAADPAHGKALGLAAATLFVFWLAHVYARTLSHHLRGAKRLDWTAVKAAMAEEWPLLEGPIPLLAILALGELHLLEGRSAVRLALWFGVLELVTWGILFARGQRWNWLPALIAGAVNGLFGLAIVILEVAIH